MMRKLDGDLPVVTHMVVGYIENKLILRIMYKILAMGEI